NHLLCDKRNAGLREVACDARDRLAGVCIDTDSDRCGVPLPGTTSFVGPFSQIDRKPDATAAIFPTDFINESAHDGNATTRGEHHLRIIAIQLLKHVLEVKTCTLIGHRPDASVGLEIHPNVNQATD